jgi:hypothetical protein
MAGNAEVFQGLASSAKGIPVLANISLDQRFRLLVRLNGEGVPITWTGCDAVVGNDCHLTMDSDKNVTAKFARAPRRER